MAKKATSTAGLIEEKLAQIGNFSRDASGPLGLEERLNIANCSVQLLKECILDLVKE